MKGLRLTSTFANLEDNNYDKILFTLKKTEHYIRRETQRCFFRTPTS